MTHSPRAQSLWPALLIVAAALLAYGNSLHGPFVFDDASSIVTNPTIQHGSRLGDVLAGPATNVTAQGRPILNLSLAINYAIHGPSVTGYHVGNLLIHALAGLVLWGILRRVVRHPGADGIALATALLWTVHPLQTESVTYTIQRAESLVGLFYLLTIYCFARGAELTVGSPARESRDEPGGTASAPSANERLISGPGRRGGRPSTVWFTLAILSCLFGMATKEVMATAPLMVLFFDRTFFAGTFRAAWRQRRAFYLALASTWVLLAWLIAQGGGNRGGSVGFGAGVRSVDYWLTQFPAIVRYLGLTFWPQPLVFEYGSFWIRDFSEFVLPAVLILGLLGATLFALHRRSALGFAGAWFFGILAPTSLAPGTTQMIVEHRMYLPVAAVLVVAVGAVHRCLTRRIPRSAVAGLVAGLGIACVLLTADRNHDYRSDIALWTDTIAKRPANPLAHFMLAGAQERAGDLAAAQKSYQRTLELKPDFSIGHENYGELLLKQGRREEAIAHFEAALRLQPEYADAHANLGNASLAEGRLTEAVGHLEKAAQLMPDAPMTRYNFGNALAAAGLPAEAVPEYEAALKLQPTLAEAHFNLANALTDLGRPADAIAHYDTAVKLRPDFAAAHYNLGNALASSGRQQEAIAHYEAALRARPDYPEAHHNLGSALFDLGRLPEAAAHYQETLRLAPDFPNARENLARVRARLK